MCIILGTRPEIIKMSPVIRYCEKNSVKYFVIHTGQHYNYNMDKLFFDELKLPPPKYNLNIGSGLHGKQTGLMLEKIEKILILEKPDIVLVEGDTNTVLAGALTATKLYIKVGHIEAGLRSYSREMPEEINRVLTDHLSDFLFAPTEKSKSNALKEGISEDKIIVVGNTIVDAVNQNLELSIKKGLILEKLGLKKRGYFLVTAHRQENVDHKHKLKNIIRGLEVVYDKLRLPIIYPIHPRTKKMLNGFKIKRFKGLHLIEPVGFLEFLQLEANAKLVLTDSGGVQEECCVLRVPCVTLRENTERPETLEVGANMLVGTNSKEIAKGVEKMINSERNWENPFGDGKSAEKIIKFLINKNVL